MRKGVWRSILGDAEHQRLRLEVAEGRLAGRFEQDCRRRSWFVSSRMARWGGRLGEAGCFQAWMVMPCAGLRRSASRQIDGRLMHMAVARSAVAMASMCRTASICIEADRQQTRAHGVATYKVSADLHRGRSAADSCTCPFFPWAAVCMLHVRLLLRSPRPLQIRLASYARLALLSGDCILRPARRVRRGIPGKKDGHLLANVFGLFCFGFLAARGMTLLRLLLFLISFGYLAAGKQDSIS